MTVVASIEPAAVQAWQMGKDHPAQPPDFCFAIMNSTLLVDTFHPTATQCHPPPAYVVPPAGPHLAHHPDTDACGRDTSACGRYVFACGR